MTIEERSCRRNAARGGAGPFGFVPRAKYDHAVAVAWAWRREADRLRSLLEKSGYLYVPLRRFARNPLRGSEIDTSWLDLANQFGLLSR